MVYILKLLVSAWRYCTDYVKSFLSHSAMHKKSTKKACSWAHSIQNVSERYVHRNEICCVQKKHPAVVVGVILSLRRRRACDTLHNLSVVDIRKVAEMFSVPIEIIHLTVYKVNPRYCYFYHSWFPVLNAASPVLLFPRSNFWYRGWKSNQI